MNAAPQSLLSVRNLTVSYAPKSGELAAVAGINLEVAPQECLAIVGESGSGKSQTCLAAMGLLDQEANASGEALFDGVDLLSIPRSQRRKINGRRLAMVFQNPKTSLTPHMTIGAQLEEALAVHEIGDRDERRQRALAALQEVRIADPERVITQYPFELSGGMNQRVGIAMALIAEPELIIADEPTTALDVTVQAEILAVLKEAQKKRGLAMIFITHDMAVVRRIADRVAVLYAGRIVEQGPVEALLYSPRHPYTKALLGSAPRLSGAVMDRLPSIPGQPPKHGAPAQGCAFAPRCDLAHEACNATPVLQPCSDDHAVACHAERPAP